MSDYIDTRDGWRRMNTGEDRPRPGTRYLIDIDEVGAETWYAREEPAPALPTTQWTVLRLQAGDVEQVGVFDGQFWRPLPSHIGLTIDDPRYPVQVLDVLAEPRAVTAKAVLKRVARDGWEASPEVWAELGVERREVES